MMRVVEERERKINLLILLALSFPLHQSLSLYTNSPRKNNLAKEFVERRLRYLWTSVFFQRNKK